MRSLMIVVVAALLCTSAAAEVEISVQAGSSAGGHNAAHEAALAEWNSPMGRLTWFMNEQQANLIRGGLPGATAAPAFRLKLQGGQPPELVAAAVDAGIDRSRATVATIPWPWVDGAASQASPLSDQLSSLLSQRLRPSSPQPGD